MALGGFLSKDERRRLVELARDGLAEHRVARRANALILLDRGMTYPRVAEVLLVDDDTIRQWHLTYKAAGIDGLISFHHQGRQPFLSTEQAATLTAWVSATLPRSTRAVGAFIAQRFGITFESRSGLIALLHRLGFVHRKPRAVARRMDPQRQRRFIACYEQLMRHLPANETVMFADAVHPTFGAQPVGCWAPAEAALAVAQTSGREHVNIQGAIDLETGTTCMQVVDTVDAQSTIKLLQSIEDRFPHQRCIHVMLDNARCHHSRLVRAWLTQPGRRIRTHFIPPYCPHLNPIERLWLLMHKHLLHNRCFDSFQTFRKALLVFLRRQVPKYWPAFRDQVTDNFRVIDPADFRIIR